MIADRVAKIRSERNSNRRGVQGTPVPQKLNPPRPPAVRDDDPRNEIWNEIGGLVLAGGILSAAAVWLFTWV